MKNIKLLFMISLRNLLRQKRRNIFLGSAMAFGVMILVTANSFSHGISDIMFNKIVSYVAGHVNVTIREGRSNQVSIFRDKERLLKIIKENSFDVQETDEALGIFLRAIGNGKADNMVLVGIETTRNYTKEQRQEYDESFHAEDGVSLLDIGRTDVENPVILSKEKAKTLNVKRGDILRIRFSNIYGQTQSARLSVIGVLSNDNIFMQGVMFVDIRNLKAMMGYRPYESPSIQLKLGNARKNAKAVADKIQAALKPGSAFIAAKVSGGGTSSPATIIPFMSDDASKNLISSSFKLSRGKMDDVLLKDGMMISQKLADKLGVSVGQKISYTFKPKFEAKEVSFTTTVKGIFKTDDNTGSDTIYMHEALFYPRFYENLPDLTVDSAKAFLPKSDVPFAKALGKEWVLLERSQSTEDLTKKMREIAKKKIKAETIDVNSMYELASDVLKLEGALNLITIGCVFVLFIIILIGVVNTLRMTIRERTREIGTIRAIGMQKRDVQMIFLLETGLLAFFSAIAGTVLGLIVMGLLSLISFNVIDNPMGILLVKQHLYFLPSVVSILIFIWVIVILAGITAFFPAHRAANISAAEALRHYE